MHHTISALAVLAAVPFTLAQTFTDCNPTEQTCPSDTALDQSSFSTDFTSISSAPSGWTLLPGTSLTYGDNGAQFTIAEVGQAPTIESNFYIFFGTIEVVMQAAPGVGIVSSVVFESDDLDEVDWEFVGADTAHAQSNYYGKGNTTTYNRVVYEDVSSPQTSFHTYGFDWSAERIIWSIDGVQVRTLEYADAVGGANFPQTPMRIRLGNWAGGCPSCAAGTAEWAGGRTDYSQGPFNMYIKSVKITNANPAAQYTYGDKTGSWQSIEVMDSAGNKLNTDSSASGNSNVAASSSASGSSSSTSAASSSASSSAAASSSSASAAASTHAHTKTASSNASSTGSSNSGNAGATSAGASQTTSSGITSSTIKTSSSTSPTAAQQTTSGASTRTISGLLLVVAALAFAL